MLPPTLIDMSKMLAKQQQNQMHYSNLEALIFPFLLLTFDVWHCEETDFIFTRKMFKMVWKPHKNIAV